MNSNKLLTLDDADLDQVAGGLGLAVGIDLGRINVCLGVDVGRGGVSAQASANVGHLKLGFGLGFHL
jgi:hypothetical protein